MKDDVNATNQAKEAAASLPELSVQKPAKQLDAANTLLDSSFVLRAKDKVDEDLAVESKGFPKRSKYPEEAVVETDELKLLSRSRRHLQAPEVELDSFTGDVLEYECCVA